MSDRHVRPADDGWTVTKAGATRSSAHTPTQAEAIARAVEIVANDGGGSVVVHGIDGDERTRREVPAHADDVARISGEFATEAAAEGAAVTAKAIGDEAGKTADKVEDEVGTTAKKVRGHAETGARSVGATASAGAEGVAAQAEAAFEGDKSAKAAAKDAATITRTTGKQAGDKIDGYAREVAGETKASAKRTAAVVEQEAGEAADALESATARAARQGDAIDEELTGVADRAGRTIHAYTEAVATPIDRLAAALNPVRITGRIVNVVTVGGLRLVGTATNRGTDRAHQGARRLQDAAK